MARPPQSGGSKVRLDQLLVSRRLAPSREKAQAMIMAGLVLLNDAPAEKPGLRVSEDADLRLRGEVSRYVGRGGDKLEPALSHFKVDPEGKIAIDLGASTGGFTDCLLQHGAKLVYAVDVGTNQLAHRLRIDPRVRVMEQTHAKELKSEQFDPQPVLATVDVSFIGLRKVLPYLFPLLAKRCEALALVKPQFELEPSFIEKGGVVTREEDQLKAVQLVEQSVKGAGFTVCGIEPAKLRGGKKGNQEYFVYFRRGFEDE